MSDAPATVDGVRGTLTVCTDHALEGSVAEGALTLAPWTGAVVKV
jgi:hypothetical protein